MDFLCKDCDFYMTSNELGMQWGICEMKFKTAKTPASIIKGPNSKCAYTKFEVGNEENTDSVD